jgi:hypothetical protein
MKHTVRGQDDTTIGVGTAGDRTIQIPISTTNVWLTNLSMNQVIMYADGASPTFPTDWNRLDPEQRLIFETPSGVLSMRKKVFYMATNIGQKRTPSIATSFQGTWNASTNTPALASGVGTEGHYYIVSVAGLTTLDGWTDWEVGDWVIFNGTTWQKNEPPTKPAEVPVTVEVEETDV